MNRTAVTPKDAATVVLVRDGSNGVEIFCVERNKQSRFMGGAIVFPGGKLDAADSSPAWLARTTSPRTPQLSKEPFANDEVHLRALAIAAARETLEEAALLHTTGAGVSNDDVTRLRERLTTDASALEAFLSERGVFLDLAVLRPLARWITPIAESRRFDARFFVAKAPEGQNGAHDERETMASFWATPAEILRRGEVGEVTLMAPTHRTISVLATCNTTEDVFDLAAKSSLDPICPRLVKQKTDDGETLALVLPGDPEHEISEVRVSGPSRYVLRGKRWCSENAPR